MTIKFNHEMFTDFNWTHINHTNTDIYIKPALHREFDDDFNISTVNLTWNVSYFNLETLYIQLDFNEPLEISPLIE